ncbi:hypothetical protein SynROS8604_03212 [Synechococcus sp. ROS8604]|nr:hypothetical protein SynROS8604_03212 [Synechococcus sp. ROS8604]
MMKRSVSQKEIKLRVKKDRHGYVQDDHPHSHDLFIQA